MKKWNYAELSKAAKEAGGPEKYIKFLEAINRQKGRSEMAPWIGVTALGASLLTIGTVKIFNIIKSRKITKENDFEAAKLELTENINKYASQHIEKGGEDNE